MDTAGNASNPYGVPTGVVPRVVNSIPPATGYATTPHVSGYVREDRSMKIKGNPLPPLQYKLTPEDEADIRRRQTEFIEGVELTALGPADPIQQAVDDYLLMERKARTWDELRDCVAPHVIDLMDKLVHPAREPSAR